MKIKAAIMVVLVLFSVQNAYAAGIVWRTESVVVNEGQEKCINYGIYNPFGQPVMADMNLEGEISGVTDFSFEPMLIPPNTMHTEAVDVPVCFKAEKLYKEDCLLGPLLCEKKCSEIRRTYTGEVVVTDQVVSATGEGMGSKVVVSASAPVELEILCVPHERDYRPLYIITVVVIIAVLAGMLFRKYRTPAIVRKQRKLEKLQAELDKEKKKTRK